MWMWLSSLSAKFISGLPFQFATTVHKDVTDRLEHINPSLASQARVVLDVNKSERHIRGGMATREKYQHRLQICSKEDE